MNNATQLPRLRPDPIPAIYPEPEFRVTGPRAQWYAEMKRSLQVPWMGVVTMAYAHYPGFFQTLWTGLKPLVESTAFVETAIRIREHVESRVERLNPSPISGRLSALGYAPRELDQIREVVEVFSHGNFLYFLIATITRLLLEGGDMRGNGEAQRYTARHAPDVSVTLTLMEAHHADKPTQANFEEIKAILGLPFVNTDYRALARWPTYFALAWRDLKPALEKPEYEAACIEIHQLALQSVVSSLPNSDRLTSGDLRAAAARDASIDEVLNVARLFQWLLPGLLTNVAFLRAQLNG